LRLLYLHGGRCTAVARNVRTSPPQFNAGAPLDNVRITALAAGSTADIPLDWAHWAAMLLLMAAATTVFARRNRTRR
jgi:hypothetical protein